jgi:hypothetical protein
MGLFGTSQTIMIFILIAVRNLKTHKRETDSPVNVGDFRFHRHEYKGDCLLGYYGF